MQIKEQLCTGCSACASFCTKEAIAMLPDDQGFLRPKVSTDCCIGCGLCKNICPVLNPPAVSADTKSFAAYALDKTLLENSSSGAIFPLLAKHVLSNGGIVFGAAFDKQFVVRHIGIETLDDLPKLCSSKYVQSEIGETYSEAKAALKAGRTVYFSGTPCQVAGLKSYLRREYENLITQDVVCHSTPSPQIWKNYKRLLEKTYNGKITSFSFRYKKNGWEGYYIRAVFDNGSEYLRKAAEDPYQQGFIKGLYSRPSCYSCRFKGIQRTSDITLADFWGVRNIMPEAYEPNGTSIVLLHSKKAENLFQKIAPEIRTFSAEANTLLTFNQAAYAPVKKPKRCKQFYKSYKKTEFGQLVEICCKETLLEKAAEVWHKSLLYRGICKICRMIFK